MKQIVAAVVAKVAVAAAAVDSVDARRIPVVKNEPQPQHIFNDRHLQDDASNTVSIGGTAFFDVNGYGVRSIVL